MALYVNYNGEKILTSELNQESFYFLRLPEHRAVGVPRFKGKDSEAEIMKRYDHKHCGHFWKNKDGSVREDIVFEDANFNHDPMTEKK
jgi:hypothetical protein